MATASQRGAKREICGSALRSASKGALGNCLVNLFLTNSWGFLAFPLFSQRSQCLVPSNNCAEKYCDRLENQEKASNPLRKRLTRWSAPGGAPESAQGNWGCSRECSQQCSMWGVNRKSIVGSIPWRTPNSPEQYQEHPLKHPNFPEHPWKHFPEHFHRFPI